MANREVSFVVTDEYKAWIEDVKSKIKNSQIKAAVKVNYELLDLYWDLGRELCESQKIASWGDGVIDAMSRDLRKTFPTMSGFSSQNLRSMRYWYKFYTTDEKCLQVVSEMETIEKLIKSIPWGHNQRIVYK